MSGDNEQDGRGLNADLLSLTDAPYAILLDLQRALDPVLAMHNDEIPYVVRELTQVIDLELGRRNNIRQALYARGFTWDAAASGDSE